MNSIHDAMENLLLQFEKAWESGVQPDIIAFFPEGGSISHLKELVCIDLERRLRQGLPRSVEEYLALFPQLGSDPDAVVDVIAAENALRARMGQVITPEAWGSRFPDLGTRIMARLSGLNSSPPVPRPGPISSSSTIGSLPLSQESGARETISLVAPTGATSPVPSAPRLPGYDLLGVLGRGGMGIVYQARQKALNRLVALKMIVGGGVFDREAVSRFRIEAEALGRLQNPNIVQVFDVGECDGRPFFSLEYVEGGSLASKLGGAPRAPRQSAQMVAVLARAMQAAHQAGVIHRDLKPANVLVGRDWTLKITDFGLAKRLDNDSGQTQTGQVLGTPSYMAPEQACGDLASVGVGTDIYALGAILYELLTGRPPFRGATAFDTVQMVRDQEPVPPRQLNSKTPRDLELICLKCLRKDPRHRYALASDLADELERFINQEPLRLTRAVSRFEKAWRWCKRNPGLAGTGVAAAVFLVIGVLMTIIYSVQSSADAAALFESNTKLTDVNQLLQGANSKLTEVNQNLAREVDRAESALKKFMEAEKGRRRFTRIAAEQLMEKGLRECEEVDPTHGLPWLVAGLQTAPPEDADLINQLKRQILVWGSHIEPMFPGPSTHPIEALALSGDGKVLAIAAARDVQLWDIGSGTPRGPKLELPEPVAALALSPNGDAWLAGTISDEGKESLMGSVHYWNGAEARKLEGSYTFFRSPGLDRALMGMRHVLAFSPDGRHMLIKSPDSKLRIWDRARLMPDGHALEGENWLLARFTADGQRLLLLGDEHRGLGSEGVRIELWDVQKRAKHIDLVPQKDMLASPFGGVSIDASGRYAIVSGLNMTGRWDLKTGEALGCWSHTNLMRDGKGAGLRAFELFGFPVPFILADGKQGALVGPFGLEVRDDIDSKEVGGDLIVRKTLRFSGRQRAAVAALDGKVVYLAEDRHVRAVSLAGNTAPWSAPSPLVHPGCSGLAVSPEGGVALTLSYLTTAPDPPMQAILWDLASGKQKHSFALKRPSTPLGAGCVLGPKGRFCLVNENDGIARKLGSRVYQLGVPGEDWELPIILASAVFLPDGDRAWLLGQRDGLASLECWDLKKRTRLRDIEPTGSANVLSLSPDGKRLFIGASMMSKTDEPRGEIRILDPESGEHLAGPWATQGSLYHLTCSPDGKTVIALSTLDALREKGLLQVLDARTGKLLSTVFVANGVSSLGFVPGTGVFATFEKAGNSGGGIGGEPVFPKGDSFSTGFLTLRDLPSGKRLGARLPIAVDACHLAANTKELLVLSGSVFDGMKERPTSGFRANYFGRLQLRRWEPRVATDAEVERIVLWATLRASRQVEAGGTLQCLTGDDWQLHMTRLRDLGGPP